MLTFNGKEIHGTHDCVHRGDVDLETSRSYFWGLRGVSEIVGGHGGRDLTVYIWLHKKYATRRALEDAIDELVARIGEHGTLIETDSRNNATMTFENCTFTSLSLQAFPGRESPGPIRDYAGTIDGGWVQVAQLKFYQLALPGGGP